MAKFSKSNIPTYPIDKSFFLQQSKWKVLLKIGCRDLLKKLWLGRALNFFTALQTELSNCFSSLIMNYKVKEMRNYSTFLVVHGRSIYQNQAIQIKWKP